MEPTAGAQERIGIKEAADHLRVSEKTFRLWCSVKGCPHYRRGPRGRYLVVLAEVYDWMRRNEVASDPAPAEATA